MGPWSHWTDLGFHLAWTYDDGPLRSSGFPHHIFANDNKNEDERFGVFLGWEESASWWQEASEALPNDHIAQSKLWAAHHQIGGASCGEFVGQLRPVQIKNAMRGPIADLCRHYFEMGLSVNPVIPPSRIDDYRRRLAAIGLSADPKVERFDEAVYPIEVTSKNLERLLTPKDPWVAKANELCKLYPPAKKRLTLYVLADNSD